MGFSKLSIPLVSPIITIIIFCLMPCYLMATLSVVKGCKKKGREKKSVILCVIMQISIRKPPEVSWGWNSSLRYLLFFTSFKFHSHRLTYVFPTPDCLLQPLFLSECSEVWILSCSVFHDSTALLVSWGSPKVLMTTGKVLLLKSL